MCEGKAGAVSGKTMVILVIIGILISAWVLGTVYILHIIGEEEEPDLVIYTYESFQNPEYGLGPAVIPKFEEMYGVKVKVVTPGDVGAVIGRLNAEKQAPQADIAIGVDNSMLYKNKTMRIDLFEPFVPGNISRLEPSIARDLDNYMVPYDYGYIAIICNGGMMEERGLEIPGDLMDLADPRYDGQLLLPDPGTSSTGSSFMIWAASVAGENYSSFLGDLADNANGRVLSSWDAMYNAWLDGEAPIAISYGLDTAYEMKYYGTNNTVTVVPDHQGYRQIEGACLVKGAPHKEVAELFLEFILSDDFQTEVHRNVMLPAVAGVELDPYFTTYGEFAARHVEPATAEVLENYDSWYQAWREAFF
ncbi:MAG: thiamine ABC transporter substrate binding subunit [Thermoplasmatota archaeon]